MTTNERFGALDTKVSKLTESLETSVRRQRITITALVLVAVAAAVMAAAPQSRDATFDTIKAKTLFIVNDAGKTMVHLASNAHGAGLDIFNAAEKRQVFLMAGEPGGGMVISNKTGEEVVQILVDEYGNGFVGAFNRKGKGQTLQPGN